MDSKCNMCVMRNKWNGSYLASAQCNPRATPDGSALADYYYDNDYNDYDYYNTNDNDNNNNDYDNHNDDDDDDNGNNDDDIIMIVIINY